MQIYIDGVPDNATDSSLEKLFAGVRSFEYVKVIRDIATGASRRFAIAFVTDDAEARAVIARLNGAVLGEGHLTVFRIHDTLAGEMEFREWMRDNAIDVLRKGGLSAGQNVVDYGCGPGIFSLAAAGIVGENGRVYALDVRQRALDGLREKATSEGLSNLHPVLIDRTKVAVDLPAETADMLLLYDVLQEIEDKPALFREIDRLLKPLGTLSVFPMHMGTEAFLMLNDKAGLFRVRERVGYPGFFSSSEIVNLTKPRL
jgi:2-polyprenyl-3-methyl-5-hydroxy-6-metoxy-1,4-benzoquinol methylase